MTKNIAIMVLLCLLLITACKSSIDTSTSTVTKLPKGSVFQFETQKNYIAIDEDARIAREQSSKSILDNIFAQVGTLGMHPNTSSHIEAVLRAFSDRSGHPYYVYLIIKSGIQKPTVVSAATEAFMCNFDPVGASQVSRRNSVLLVAPAQATANIRITSPRDLTHYYHFEAARKIDTLLANNHIKSRGYSATVNTYLLATALPLKLTHIFDDSNRNIALMNRKKIIADVFSLDEYSPAEIGRLFEGLRLKLVGKSAKTAALTTQFNEMHSPKAMYYFRRFIDMVPALLSSANARTSVCAYAS